MRRACAGALGALVLGACGRDAAPLPAFAASIDAAASVVLVLPDEALRARLIAVLEPLAARVGLEQHVAADRLWYVDPRAPSPLASLAESRTFRAALAARPLPDTGASWCFVDLQALTDGVRARLVELAPRIVPVFDALGLGSLAWAAGELTSGETSLALDLSIRATDDVGGPLAWLSKERARESLLAGPEPAESLGVEFRFTPSAVARALDSIVADRRPGELRLDGVMLDAALHAARALCAKLDGRLSLRLAAPGRPTLALGLADGEAARAALAALLPRRDREAPLQLGGLQFRFDADRLLLGVAEAGAAEGLPRGGAAPPGPLLVWGRVPELGALRIELTHEGELGLRLTARID
ncbi:MAG: hypothetical protein IT457_13760 [Planctomycetes bacterium]|nr:hypothetical protein [Planctomycetota bacterium]